MTPAPDDDPFGPLLADPGGAGLFTDFDGTLAPIVDDPDTSRPLPGAPAVLEGLAGRLARVGVVSGRPVDVLERFFAPAIALSGLYGLQRSIGGRRLDHPEAAAWGPVVDDAVERARTAGPEGVRVEHKGLSVTLHYRERPDLAVAAEEWAAAESSRTGLGVHRARMSVELHPPIDADKGTAMLTMAEGLRVVAFVGDDVGDLPAFAALDDLATRGVRGVKVAVHSAEQDPRLADAADAVVDGPEAVLGLFASLLDRLG
ncbi:MAG: trehalose-phosphatase [Acidimicrobiales bacterium]|nr:trehalose-phosphatase [Acidimicrobiales bacterium]